MYLARDDDDAFLYGEPTQAEAQTADLASSGKTLKYVVGDSQESSLAVFCLPNIIQRELTLRYLVCGQCCNRKSLKVRENGPS